MGWSMKINTENSNNKLSLSYLNEKFGGFNCELCLLELPEKKTYRSFDERSGFSAQYYVKGIFIAWDRSSTYFVALLEDLYSGRNTGKRNIATSYYMSHNSFKTIWEQLISEGKTPIITFNNFSEKDYIAYNGETFL